MTFLISVAYIIFTPVVCFYLYNWSAVFKEMSEYSEEDWDKVTEEIGASRNEVRYLSNTQKKVMKHGNKFLFLTVGSLIWIFLGVTIGKITSSITDHSVLKWVAYFGMYFVFLRFPFAVINGVIETAYEIEKIPEKALFAILMIGFYALSICCYAGLPSFFKWHLYFLN